MKRLLIFTGICVSAIFLACQKIYAHCEIPCGIYGDDGRFIELAEDINTIEKSMNQIKELSKDPNTNINQLVRWVQNKEAHANKISEIVTTYFMKQRIKPVPESKNDEYMDYIHKLTLLHQIMVHSMKAKQTTDIEHVKEMTSLLEKFHKAYHPEEFKNVKTQ